MRVRPGDVAVGHDDGVAFIPQEAYDEVMKRVCEIDEIERRMDRIFAEGGPIEEVLKLSEKKAHNA